MRHGFLFLDKPAGVTSHDMVGTARRALNERAIGHLGTLDPAATGLLVLAVGRKALKVVELFKDLPKEYEADLVFGSVSSTYDRDGVIEVTAPKLGWQVPEQVAIQRLLGERFTGRISQVPPAYSAVHIDGERAYALAMQGKTVSIPPREVEIKRLEILSYEYPAMRLRIACGSGTYIRSLAHDLGQLLRCGAYLSALRRTAVGEWTLADAVTVDDIAWTKVHPLKDVLTSFPRRDLTDDEYQDIGFGRAIEASVEPRTIAWHGDLPVALLEPIAEGVAKPRKVF